MIGDEQEWMMALVYGVQDEAGRWFGPDPGRVDWTRQGQLRVPQRAASPFAGRIVPVRYGPIEGVPGRRVELLDGTVLHLTDDLETYLAYPEIGVQP